MKNGPIKGKEVEVKISRGRIRQTTRRQSYKEKRGW